ncbi:MAG: hypothetical protein MPL62_16015, partial [Alphaproteobacteria bacterium]|nr:hypothetical protein [Alphaproteobacteria bacterium]
MKYKNAASITYTACFVQILSAGERAKNTKVKKGRKSARIVYIGHNPHASGPVTCALAIPYLFCCCL